MSVRTNAVLRRWATGLFAAMVASAAQAAPVVYFGENQTPGGALSGTPVLARAAFLSNLTGVVSEGFESFNLGATAPLALSFTGSGSTTLTATLSGAGTITNNPAVGRFNTTTGGSRWWDVNGAFDIAFGTAISAFGFYGTDIGDFDGQVTIALTDINNVVTNLTVGNLINGANGSLLFFGFVDAGNSYTRLRFGNTSPGGTDFFGFDDMVIGDQRQIVNATPEPATLALLGFGLAGLAFSGRRKPVPA